MRLSPIPVVQALVHRNLELESSLEHLVFGADLFHGAAPHLEPQGGGKAHMEIPVCCQDTGIQFGEEFLRQLLIAKYCVHGPRLKILYILPVSFEIITDA